MKVRNRRTGRVVELPDDDGLVFCYGRLRTPEQVHKLNADSYINEDCYSSPEMRSLGWGNFMMLPLSAHDEDNTN